MCFSRGKLISSERKISTEKDGLKVMFKPDSDVFANFAYRMDIVREIIKEYCYLRSGLRIIFNGESFIYENGLHDMISESISAAPLYEPIHIFNDDFEIVFTHTDNQEEDIRSYVNGHYTPEGGTHLTAFRKAITKVMSDYFKTKLSVSETCKGIVCAFNVNLSNPYFTGACKFELYSKHMWEYDDGNTGPSIYNSIKDFLSSMLPKLLAGNNVQPGLGQRVSAHRRV
jgi:topoisomerase-4 subunit B